MKSIISLLFVLIFASFSLSASASEPLKVGGQVDVGILSGAAIGVVVKPKLNWLRLELAGTYNTEFGLRGSATVDPIKFPIAPTFTLQAGHTFESKLPGATNTPDLGMNYVDFHLGLELGKRDRWRFFLHAGPSYVSVRSSNFQAVVNPGNGVTVGNPEFHGWLFPTAAIGYTIFF